MLGDSYRAQLQRRVAGGRAEDICGPRRGEKRKAEEDLEALRAAAEQAGPDAAWSAMADVSQCLQERARFEALVFSSLGARRELVEGMLFGSGQLRKSILRYGRHTAQQCR